jgi:hypothetical protein
MACSRHCNTTNNSNEIFNLKINNSILHPLTCNWYHENNEQTDICLSKYKYDTTTDKFNFQNNFKCSYNLNISEYKQMLYIPPVGISSDNLLKLYNITSESSLIEWINNYTETNNILTINRILNCWIINNIDILKNHNNILIDIYNNLILKYSKSDIIKLIDDNKINLQKETKYFIDYWINKFNNEFYFNLLEEYIIYLNKKYI